jgi:class 3 adenylate cyclase/tetratricopeptide (TPR) repeat protein
MDVGVWLRSLGLGRYEVAFSDNSIDADVLADLSDSDLAQLGVNLGHRKRLLKAIAGLGATGPAAKPTSPAPLPLSTDTAERRPITVMFCDLVGSTSLAAKLDAEDWRNLVNAYLDEASKAVTALGGHVLKRLGDGVMALFGYPVAQENDAERAVRAALAIQRALSDLNARHVAKGAPELSARIGLESGPVVVEAAGEVFGDAPNVAARVQAEAEPGSVLITLNVQRQVAGLFVVEEQSTRELKGLSRPVQLFRIVRASGGGRRGGARTLTPFVGREEELGMLARRWDRARAGEGQLVLIVGEPGLGKSRLIEEFHSQLAETPHTWSEWSASQLLQNTPLHPIAEWGRQRFGVDAPAEQRLADLENTLRLVGLDPAEHAPLLAPLVDIPLPPERAAGFPPEELRRRQLAAMTALVLAGARSQPVVLVFEDLHWADPTSLDLLRALADRGAQASLLLLATTRPEFRAPWSLRSHHSLIALSPLDRTGVARMVSEISASHVLSKEVIEVVSKRTGGVPLFVEEVTRLLLEGGEQGGVQAIPPTLQQSLAARLDRLGPAREVAQIGAVLGRDFGYRLLRGVAELDEPALQSSLDRLAEADLLFVEGEPPQANYRFKHALIQDAAYDSLLKSRRKALHRRAAEILRDNAERAAAEPEVVAHHFTQAGLDDLAIEWWGKAGDQALRRSAFQEAIAHLGKAIAMADKATAAGVATRKISETAASLRAKFQTEYAQALTWSKGWSADETRAAWERTGDLANLLESTADRFPALYGQCVWSLLRGEIYAARDIAERFLREAEAEERIAEVGVARRLLGNCCLQIGELARARSQLELALSSCEGERGSAVAEKFGQDPEVTSKAFLALASWHLGDLHRARQLIEEAIVLATRLGHLPSTVFALSHKISIEARRDDLETVVADAENLLRISEQHRMEWFVTGSRVALSWARGRLGARLGADELRESITAFARQGPRLGTPYALGLLAELEAAEGDDERALATVDQGLATARDTGEHVSDAKLLRLRGDILAKRDPANTDKAEEAFKTAIATAQQQGARSYNLLASLPLAKLYRSTRRPAEAHAVLAPALEGFRPTPEMPEIAEAEALLAALAGTDEVKVAIAQRERRLHLQTAYGQAVMWSKGYAAEETRAAFARVRELADGTENAAERFSAYYAQWVRSLFRGEHRQARGTAEAFLREAEEGGYVTEAGVARRCLGLTCLNHGDLIEARTLLERALADYRPDRDAEALLRFGLDSGVAAAAWLASATWHLGEVKRARQLTERAVRSAAELGHVPSRALAYFVKTALETNCGDPAAALRSAETLLALARGHGMDNYIALGEAYAAWARGRLDDPEAAAQTLRRVLAGNFAQGNRNLAPLFHGWLAELEAATRGPDAALMLIDQGLAIAEETGERLAESYLHRLRGTALLKRDPESRAPAEQSFQTSIAIAKRQSARSYELLASLALAKLYQSTGRPVEAHSVLAPALEGFAPTPEMPEIEEAQALLATLAQSDDVEAATEQHRRRLDLQTSYGQALLWARGFTAEETKAAFARVDEIVGPSNDLATRITICDAQCLRSFMRGEYREAREIAETLLREAGPDARGAEVGTVRRMLGLVHLYQGNLKEAQSILEREATEFQLGPAGQVTVAAFLALTEWHLGEIERARQSIERAIQRADETADPARIGTALFFRTVLESRRDDVSATRLAADALLGVSEQYGMKTYSDQGKVYANWARGRLLDPDFGANELEQALTAYTAEGNRADAPSLYGLLAELEASELGPECSLPSIDRGLAIADETGEHFTDPYLHRLRGELLLKRNPSEPAPVEAAFKAAIAAAKVQGSRSYELLASLSLAKLYQSTGRPAEAQTVLAPALEGFAPTPEMPEIAEAQALLAAIEAAAQVRPE